MSRKAATLAVLSLVGFVQGMVGQWVYPGQSYTKSDLAFVLVEAALIFVWFRLDSTQRGYRRTPWLNIGVAGLAIVALPYYFFRSRGLRGGLLALGYSLAFAFGLGVLTTLGEYVIYYGLQT